MREGEKDCAIYHSDSFIMPQNVEGVTHRALAIVSWGVDERQVLQNDECRREKDTYLVMKQRSADGRDSYLIRVSGIYSSSHHPCISHCASEL